MASAPLHKPELREFIPAQVKEAFTTTARLYFDPANNLLKIVITEGAHLTIEDVKNHFRVTQQLTEGKKVKVLFDSRSNYSITSEARAEVARLSGSTRIATAIVTDNPISRVISNLYIRLNQPPIPTRLFDSEAIALEWLNKFS